MYYSSHLFLYIIVNILLMYIDDENILQTHSELNLINVIKHIFYNTIFKFKIKKNMRVYMILFIILK